MLENILALLDQKRRESAHSALRESLVEICSAAFAAGELRHPLLHPKSAELRRELGGLAARLLENPARARAAVLALDQVDRAVRTKSVDEHALDRLNFALQGLVPDIALVLDEALENARFKLGAAASNVEDPLAGAFSEAFIRPEAKFLLEIADEGMRAMEGGRLARLQKIGLHDLDVPEGEPRILDLRERQMGLRCPACAQRVEASLDAVGDDLRCACCAPIKVPRPSLARMAIHLKGIRDTRRGIARCRICSGVIQVSKNVFMRAGFCSAICARKGRDDFQEHVAPEGVRDGDEVRFRCACGATILAPIPQLPEKVACLSCPLEVWVPIPAVAAGSVRVRALLTCKCGRPVKSTALKCLYCGAPPPAP